MQAHDIMTTNVITVTPDTEVAEVARLLLEKGISAVPVVGEDGRLLGIVSEGDLISRPESETEHRRRSWWLTLMAEPGEQVREFLKSHGRKAEDVMTRAVVTVAEDAPVGEIAQLLEERRIKRVPVVSNGKVVGIVSRANLLRGLAAHREPLPVAPTPDDRTIRDKVDALITREGWITHGSVNVIVADGMVELWGLVDSEEERRALCVAVEELAGVRAVEDHLGLIPPYLRGT